MNRRIATVLSAAAGALIAAGLAMPAANAGAAPAATSPQLSGSPYPPLPVSCAPNPDGYGGKTCWPSAKPTPSKSHKPRPSASAISSAPVIPAPSNPQGQGGDNGQLPRTGLPLALLAFLGLLVATVGALLVRAGLARERKQRHGNG